MSDFQFVLWFYTVAGVSLFIAGEHLRRTLCERLTAKVDAFNDRTHQVLHDTTIEMHHIYTAADGRKVFAPTRRELEAR